MSDGLVAALLGVCGSVDRYEAQKRDPPYIVWQEHGPGGHVVANGKHKADAISGTIDMFLDDEDDSVFPRMRKALNGVPGLAWGYESTQYEKDTGLIHHEWSFELCV